MKKFITIQITILAGNLLKEVCLRLERIMPKLLKAILFIKPIH